MIVNIVSVDVEVKKPGPKGWSLASVTYLDQGQQKRQNVASFKAPAVFAAVQKHIGEEVEVTSANNDKGYPEWTRVVPTGNSGIGGVASAVSARTGSSAPPVVARTTGNFETPAERARRQVLIVRQSSLTAAAEFYKLNESSPDTPEDMAAVAQKFVDWVFDESTGDEPSEL